MEGLKQIWIKAENEWEELRRLYLKEKIDNIPNKSDYILGKVYDAGYRKQSEGEWRSELVKKCDWKGKKHDYYQPNSCSLCHEAVLKRTPFCPHCGAKMKGGAE